MNEYEPYGPEWEKELSKWNKRMLIDLIRDTQLKSEANALAFYKWLVPNNEFSEKELSELLTRFKERGQTFWVGYDKTGNPN